MGPERIARILALPLSDFGRRFLIAEVLGISAFKRGPMLRPPPPTSNASPPKKQPTGKTPGKSG